MTKIEREFKKEKRPILTLLGAVVVVAFMLYLGIISLTGTVVYSVSVSTLLIGIIGCTIGILLIIVAFRPHGRW
jgi:hypothetical protein